ncbi:unnamed protein product [Prunus armeniaca]
MLLIKEQNKWPIKCLFQWLQGGFDFKHVLCKLKIHLSDLHCINGEHHSFPDLCHCSCTQVLDLRSPRGLAKVLGRSSP